MHKIRNVRLRVVEASSIRRTNALAAELRRRPMRRGVGIDAKSVLLIGDGRCRQVRPYQQTCDHPRAPEQIAQSVRSSTPYASIWHASLSSCSIAGSSDGIDVWLVYVMCNCP